MGSVATPEIKHQRGTPVPARATHPHARAAHPHVRAHGTPHARRATG
jgi:hypothetical protein